jgi:segregation and condensation protein A
VSYHVSSGGFEGPFDLLLRLVTRQKVDIGAVSVSDIADQYLAEVERLHDLDLEVASDFVLVASTLLELKAASLVPEEIPSGTAREEDDEELELSPEQLRDILVERLIVYRQFKNVASALEARAAAEARMHPRTAGPESDFDGVSPNYLEGLPLITLAQICARLDGKREKFLLESEHIAAKRLPLETRVEEVDREVTRRGRMTFDELVEKNPTVENRVVSLLAILELHKRNSVRLEQKQLFGTIVIDHVSNAPAFDASRDAASLSIEGLQDEDQDEPEGSED